MISTTVTEKEWVKVGINLSDLHFEQRLWINKLKFYKSQIDILQDNLDSLVRYYFNNEIMTEVEQYQNKFIVYRELIDRLIKDHKCFRNQIHESLALPGNNTNYDNLIAVKKELGSKTADFMRFFEDLKTNFIYFYTSHYISENHPK